MGVGGPKQALLWQEARAELEEEEGEAEGGRVAEREEVVDREGA